jgi:outer membrane lipoprotein-sorting protein
MSELHEQESEFSRLLHELPFDDLPRPEHAELLRQQALARFDQAGSAHTAEQRWKHAFSYWRETMRRPIPRLIVGAAACLAILATWLMFPGPQSTARAFDRFVDAVVTAKTARFQMTVAVEGQQEQSFKAWYLAPAKYRQELGKIINVTDLSAGKIVTLMPDEKKAMIMKFTGMPKDQATDNYFERLRVLLASSRDAKNQQVEQLGEKEVDGKRAQGFRLDSPTGQVILWGDVKTSLPVRIESTFKGIPQTKVTMSEFEVNIPLEESLFDLTPPAGFASQTLEVDASKPVEKDLVQAFRVCSDLSGGEFPETLDTAGVNKLIMKFAMSQGKDFSDDKVQQLMKDALQIGRGFQFPMWLPRAADAHYAGKNAKRSEKARPLFWYKPEGTQQYRVLDSDLTLHDSNNAPQVQGAVRIDTGAKVDKPKEQ